MSESLHYEQRGAAGSQDWVVLLHPTPVDHCFWLPAAASLEDSYRVLLPDLPGHGLSALAGEAVSIGSMAVAVLALLDRQGIETAAFCGCSIGGYLLYELWRQAPERVRAMAFVSAKPHADSEEGRRVRAQTIADLEAHGTREFFGRMLQLVAEPARRQDSQIVERMRVMMERMSPEAAIAIQRALAARPDSRPTASTISVPTAVLAGALDTICPPAELRELADLVPQSTYFLLQEMGHYLPYEQPGSVGALLRRFLDDHL